MEISNSNEDVVLQAPEYAPVKENEQVLLSLGITADHIAALPIIVNTGPVFLLLELRNKEMLHTLHPVRENMRLLAQQYNLSGYCLFSRFAGRQADAIARTFVFSDQPALVAGSLAAGALACYLYDIAMIKKIDMVILHTDSPGSPVPGRITVHLRIQEGKIVALQPGTPEPVQ